MRLALARRRPGAPYGRRWRRQAGFSLLETMIAATILSILLMALMVVVIQGQNTFDALSTRATTQMQVEGALDRMVKELRAGSMGNLFTGPPASFPQYMVEGETYDNVTFIPVIGASGTSALFGAPVTYWFQYDSGEETTLGADDDSDGIVDEGRLFRRAAGSDIPICGRVTTISFTRLGEQLSVVLTVAGVDDKQYVHQFTGESSISFRNQ